MKANRIHTIILAVLLIAIQGLVVSKAVANTETPDSVGFVEYTAIVKDAETNKPIVFASVNLENTFTTTVTNTDGRFRIKVNAGQQSAQIVISHLGYFTQKISLPDIDDEKFIIKLQQAVIPLKEVSIYPENARRLIETVIDNTEKNYGSKPYMMKGFYRETIKRNRSYVAISEAIVDISKASYTSYKGDQVSIFKGRKSVDYSKLDTLVFKLQGGPATAMLLDIIKNPFNLLRSDVLDEYAFHFENVTEINGKQHFVVSFQQVSDAAYPLYEGKYYINTETMALSSAEFSLNLSDQKAATNLLIRKKPLGVKVNTRRVNYIVNYRQQGNKWYFNHARCEMAFKLNWKRKLFHTYYTAVMEMAVTDKSSDLVRRFKRDEKFSSRDVFFDEISTFADPEFWGPYNTIEPDESIQKTINRLKKRGKF